MRDYQKFLDLLDGADVDPMESSRRASQFLVAMAFVSHDLVLAEYKEAITEDNHDQAKAEQLLTAPDSLKNAPARDAFVVRSPVRREKYEIWADCKSKFHHLKRLFEIFQEAHQFYRQKGNQQ